MRSLWHIRLQNVCFLERMSSIVLTSALDERFGFLCIDYDWSVSCQRPEREYNDSSVVLLLLMMIL